MTQIKQRYTYGKNEKLKSTKLIDLLFKEGKSLQQYPIRFLWMKVDSESNLQASVAVSKRFFAKAVDRNKLKRHLREAWRLQKNTIETELLQKEMSIAGMIVFTGKVIKDHQLIAASLEKILLKLRQQIDEL